MDAGLAILLGAAGGVVAGMLGVGGGILFVPALALFLDEGQLGAEATSLAAIIPVAVVGSWRQLRYGNVRAPEAAAVGVLAIPGVGVGVVVANAVSERALEIGFAALLLGVAAQLVRRAQPPRSSAPLTDESSALRR